MMLIIEIVKKKKNAAFGEAVQTAGAYACVGGNHNKIDLLLRNQD